MSVAYAPDGGQHLMFIVGVDANGKEITHRSNAVRPDDAIAPPTVPAAPVITSIEYDQGSIWIDFTCATPGLVTNYQIFRSVDEEVQDFYANQPAPATRFYDLSPSGVTAHFTIFGSSPKDPAAHLIFLI